jgi:hypothetical protein
MTNQMEPPKVKNGGNLKGFLESGSEAAMAREVPKIMDRIFTREVVAGRRRFFFDLGNGTQQRVLKISELEKVGKEEKAYTLIVYEREIPGFYRALTDAMKKLDG